MDLTKNFEETFGKIAECVEHDFDIESLKKFVIPPEKQEKIPVRQSGLGDKLLKLSDKVGRKYARGRLMLMGLTNRKSLSSRNKR